MNLASLSCGGDGKWTGQEVPERPDGDNQEDKEDKKSLREANKQKEEDEAVQVLPVVHALVMPSLPPTIVKEMEEIILRLGFSQAVVLKLVDDQGIDSPGTLASHHYLWHNP